MVVLARGASFTFMLYKLQFYRQQPLCPGSVDSVWDILPDLRPDNFPAQQGRAPHDARQHLI